MSSSKYTSCWTLTRHRAQVVRLPSNNESMLGRRAFWSLFRDLLRAVSSKFPASLISANLNYLNSSAITDTDNAEYYLHSKQQAAQYQAAKKALFDRLDQQVAFACDALFFNLLHARLFSE